MKCPCFCVLAFVFVCMPACNALRDDFRSNTTNVSESIIVESYFGKPNRMKVKTGVNLRTVLRNVEMPSIVAETFIRKNSSDRLKERINDFVEDSVVVYRGSEVWFFAGLARYDLPRYFALKQGDRILTMPLNKITKMFFGQFENMIDMPHEVYVYGAGAKESRKYNLGFEEDSEVFDRFEKNAVKLIDSEQGNIWDRNALWDTTIVSKDKNGVIQHFVFFAFPKDLEMKGRLRSEFGGRESKSIVIPPGSIIEFTSARVLFSRFR